MVPAAQMPCWPVEHAAPPPGLPSSTTPSQLLSRPSQTSGVGFVLRLQTSAPPVQDVVPAAQTPCWPVLQVGPAPGLPLSTVPSQSLSMPSQTSGVGPTLRLQTIAPAVQDVVPAAHAPSCPVRQARPPPGLPLSTTPSQS